MYMGAFTYPPLNVVFSPPTWEIGRLTFEVIRSPVGPFTTFFPWVSRKSTHIFLAENSSPSPRYDPRKGAESAKKRHF